MTGEWKEGETMDPMSGISKAEILKAVQDGAREGVMFMFGMQDGVHYHGTYMAYFRDDIMEAIQRGVAEGMQKGAISR